MRRINQRISNSSLEGRECNGRPNTQSFFIEVSTFFFYQKRTNYIKGYLHQAWSAVLAKRDSRLAACAGVLVRRLLFDEGLHSITQTCNV